MPTVPIPLDRMRRGELPAVCLMTGARDDIELVDLHLVTSEGMSVGWSWSSLGVGLEHATASTGFRLPMSRAAARRWRWFRRAQALTLLALLAGAVGFYATQAGALLARTTDAGRFAAVAFGPLVPFVLGLIVMRFVLRPRYEPALVSLGQGWAHLRFPSDEAARALEALQRPQT